MANSKMYGGKLKLNDIPKDKIFKSDKGNLYLDVIIWVNPDDQPDDYDNHVSIQVGQSKEEREAGKAKIYLGNAKLLVSGGMEKATEEDLNEMAF